MNPGPSRSERVLRCVDRIEEMKGLGITALLDPCPSDLGRDVELMAEVAQRTRFQLICATHREAVTQGKELRVVGRPAWLLERSRVAGFLRTRGCEPSCVWVEQ